MCFASSHTHTRTHTHTHTHIHTHEQWYSATPDYNLPNSGSPTFQDFSYYNVTFPNPASQLDHYRTDLHFRFGGIRKPRLGNSDLLVMAKNKGWLIDSSYTGGGRNLNYSISALRTWFG